MDFAAVVAIASPWIVAAIGAAALIIVRKVRGPVTIQDLWAENRNLRTDVKAQRSDINTMQRQINQLINASNMQLAVNRTLGDGFDALSAGIERADVRIAFTRAEQEAIERARAVRADDTRWDTLQRAGLPEMPDSLDEEEI